MPSHKPSKNTLIFTDFDATLLEYESCSFAPAHEMLNFLKIHNIPLIIVTSKIKEEVLRIQKRLGITGSMIIENGAGVFQRCRRSRRAVRLQPGYQYRADADLEKPEHLSHPRCFYGLGGDARPQQRF
ncbi:MAG: HAD hydrolase family protein [Campylobacterales bacterium]|nr:HAD hydrolase family protein [Campylobacterales bacterium]